VKPAVNQCGFSIGGHYNSTLGRDFATLEACKANGITYSAYSPLGGLTGIDILHDPDVVRIAAKYAKVRKRWRESPLSPTRCT
jgi:diketogulonate reductase-like aldo/keto reductase